MSNEQAIDLLDNLIGMIDDNQENDYDEALKRGIKAIQKLEQIDQIINAPPSAEPKTGHWIAQDIHNCHTDFKCSECGYIHNFMHLYGEPTADYTYCPNCGTKMIEPQESEDKDAYNR